MSRSFRRDAAATSTLRRPPLRCLTELIAQAQTFLALAIGSSTRQTYSTGLKSFIAFVDTHGIRPAFPASVQTLYLWISFLASPPRALTLGTCKVYLSAVVTRHTELGYDHPLPSAPPMLSRIMAGIKRMYAIFQIQPCSEDMHG